MKVLLMSHLLVILKATADISSFTKRHASPVLCIYFEFSKLPAPLERYTAKHLEPDADCVCIMFVRQVFHICISNLTFVLSAQPARLQTLSW